MISDEEFQSRIAAARAKVSDGKTDQEHAEAWAESARRTAAQFAEDANADRMNRPLMLVSVLQDTAKGREASLDTMNAYLTTLLGRGLAESIKADRVEPAEITLSREIRDGWAEESLRVTHRGVWQGTLTRFVSTGDPGTAPIVNGYRMVMSARRGQRD